MERNVVLIDASDNVANAVKIMLDKKIWSLVISEASLPVGFASERDIIRRCVARGLDPEYTKMEDVMSSPLVTAEPDTPLAQIMTLMVSKNIRRVYIVEKGQIIGRITQTGAFNEIIKIMMTLSGVL